MIDTRDSDDWKEASAKMDNERKPWLQRENSVLGIIVAVVLAAAVIVGVVLFLNVGGDREDRARLDSTTELLNTLTDDDGCLLDQATADDLAEVEASLATVNGFDSQTETLGSQLAALEMMLRAREALAGLSGDDGVLADDASQTQMTAALSAVEALEARADPPSQTYAKRLRPTLDELASQFDLVNEVRTAIEGWTAGGTVKADLTRDDYDALVTQCQSIANEKTRQELQALLEPVGAVLTEREATAAAKAVEDANCASVIIPERVDRSLVCGPVPTSSVVLPSFAGPSYLIGSWDGFTSPSGNLACSWYDLGTVVCKAVTLDVPYPYDPATEGVDYNCRRGLEISDSHTGMACAGDIRVIDEIPNLPNAPVLDYGQIVLSTDYRDPYPNIGGPSQQPVACHSAEDGITCWNTVTRHGIKISRSLAVFW